MKFKLLLYLLICFLLCGCEGYRILNGLVLSDKTNKPIANAQVYVLNGRKQLTRTNSFGRFSITSEFGGLFLRGPKFVFEVSKDGYKTKLVKKKGTTLIVRLEEE
jgi:hypothetical protein